jgi:hypothetical protein
VQTSSVVKRYVSRVRTIAAWAVLPTFASMFVANQYIIRNFPVGDYLAPKPPQSILMWRNVSLVTVVICILVSIPRWQSLLGIGGIIVFFFLFGG